MMLHGGAVGTETEEEVLEVGSGLNLHLSSGAMKSWRMD